MTSNELAFALGELKQGIEGLHQKLDEMVLPSCQEHDRRITLLEQKFWTATGVAIVIVFILVLGQDLLLLWARKKLGV